MEHKPPVRHPPTYTEHVYTIDLRGLVGAAERRPCGCGEVGGRTGGAVVSTSGFIVFTRWRWWCLSISRSKSTYEALEREDLTELLFEALLEIEKTARGSALRPAERADFIDAFDRLSSLTFEPPSVACTAAEEGSPRRPCHVLHQNAMEPQRNESAQRECPTRVPNESAQRECPKTDSTPGRAFFGANCDRLVMLASRCLEILLFRDTSICKQVGESTQHAANGLANRRWRHPGRSH